MAPGKLRALVVDDTALYRKVIKDILESITGIEVVGTAPNGKIALMKVEQLKPDMLTLDVEMPEMDGLETLRNLRRLPEKPAVIMVSSLTHRDAEVTLQALQLGAFDFIAKPSGANVLANMAELKQQFIPKIEALLKRYIPPPTEAPKPPVSFSPPQGHKPRVLLRPRIVALGVSTGGPKALADVIPRLPKDFPAPIVIVQHMPPVFTKALAESLDKKSALTVVEAEDGMVIQPGYVYLAPGGKQMKVAANGQAKIKITDDPPENHCKPSADYLFRSVYHAFGNRTLGVIMTGMGKDGTEGLKLLKSKGAYVLAQDEASCVVFGMPMEAIKAGVVDEVLPLNQLAEKITRIARGF